MVTNQSQPVFFLPCGPDEMFKMRTQLWFHLGFIASMWRPSCELMLSPHLGHRCAFDGKLTETKRHRGRNDPFLALKAAHKVKQKGSKLYKTSLDN